MDLADYVEFDALGLATLIARRETSPGELLDAAIALCERVDPAINAVVHRLDDHARRAIARGLPEGPFRGVPFLVKDDAAMAGVVQSRGSRLFADFMSEQDSDIVSRFRRAGLVIFGRTNMPELGQSTSTEPRLFGPCRNPWKPSHSSGGSSGGSCAAVAARIVPTALASDGGGSIRIPAAHCAVFGLKPSRGLTPFGPDAGEALGGMSARHVVTRSVRDSAAILDVMTAMPDVGAPYAAPAKRRPFLSEVGAPAGRLKVALVTRPFFDGPSVHPDCAAAARAAAVLLEDLGHAVDEAELVPDIPEWQRFAVTVVIANLRSVLEARSAALGRPLQPGDLETLVWERVMGSGPLSAVDYVRAVNVMHRVGRIVGRFFARYDLMLTPTTCQPPCLIGVMDMMSTDRQSVLAAGAANIGFTRLFNVAGNPAASVPWCWNAEGLPIGIQLAAPLGGEARLFNVAAQIEEARPWAGRLPSLLTDVLGNPA